MLEWQRQAEWEEERKRIVEKLTERQEKRELEISKLAQETLVKNARHEALSEQDQVRLNELRNPVLLSITEIAVIFDMPIPRIFHRLEKLEAPYARERKSRQRRPRLIYPLPFVLEHIDQLARPRYRSL